MSKEDADKSTAELLAELHQLRQRLREAEKRSPAEATTADVWQLHRIADFLEEGLLVTTIDDEIIYANARMAEMTGYAHEAMLGQYAYKLLLPPEQWPTIEEKNRERQRGQSEQYELYVRHRDGHFLWMLITASPYRSTNGEIIGTVGAHIDITERKHLQEDLANQTVELKHNNAQLAQQSRLLEAYQHIGEMALSSLDLDQILDTLGVQIVHAGIFRSLMIALVDEEQHSVEVVRIKANSPDPSHITHPENGRRYDLDDDNITAEVARNGKLQVIEGWSERFDKSIHPRKSDCNKVSYFIPVVQEERVLAVLATGSTIEDKEQVLARIEAMQPLLKVVAIALEHARIYRELGESEAKLRQAQKMEAIGQLTAGIAHNFNNLLVGIMGNVQLAQQDAPATLQPLLASADHSARQAAHMVKQLMAYSRQDMQAPYRAFDLEETLAEVVSVCSRAMDRKIAIEIRSRPQLPFVLGDEIQLKQIFMNLLLNARDALEGPLDRLPSILIEASPFSPPTAADSTPHFVQIDVRDNGPGMEEQVRSRVFDPFFTTKTLDRGTGLGLSTVYGIARQHGGWVICESQVGVGTTFSVFLPTGQAEDPQPLSKAIPISTNGTETLLLIDDEEEVRNVLKRTLERRGYEILLAKDGKEGLALFAERRDAIDLVLLDLSMPQMSGQEVLPRLCALQPAIKIIVLTGYTFGAEDFAHATDVLQKPPQMGELARRIRAALDGP